MCELRICSNTGFSKNGIRKLTIEIMLAFLTCQNKLTCDRHICTNKSATIYGIVNDPLIYSIPSSKTIYFVISFNATCFHRKLSSSGVLYRTLKIKVI